MLEIARGYASRGWSVIPVSLSKKPLFEWREFQARIASDEELVCWWGRGKPPGIAIVCGPISNLMVLDVESTGLAFFHGYQTLTAKSGRDGRHYYFHWTEAHVRHVFSHDGVRTADLKGHGGYVLAPPSESYYGRYEWMNDSPIADFPLESRFLDEDGSSCAHPTCRTLRVGDGEYVSRSERLLALANKVVNAGGTKEDVWDKWMEDSAGTKVLQMSKKNAAKYLDRVYQLAAKSRDYRPPPMWATVISVSVSKSPDRVEVKLKTDDGRFVRQGVDVAPGKERWEAFHKALPNPKSGDRVLVELFETEYNERRFLKVGLWLRGDR